MGRKQIIREVMDDLISPRELSNRHNLPVEKIQKIVKDSGYKLPNRYKTIASNKTSRYGTVGDDRRHERRSREGKKIKERGKLTYQPVWTPPHRCNEERT